jgi:hypothetical protein
VVLFAITETFWGADLTVSWLGISSTQVEVTRYAPAGRVKKKAAPDPTTWLAKRRGPWKTLTCPDPGTVWYSTPPVMMRKCPIKVPVEVGVRQLARAMAKALIAIAMVRRYTSFSATAA